jgi:hypothetical protein
LALGDLKKTELALGDLRLGEGVRDQQKSPTQPWFRQEEV